MTVEARERHVLLQVARDAITLRYRKTHFGWLWLVFRPLVGALGATFLFSGVLSVRTDDGAPYLLFALAGQAAWGVLDSGLIYATRSLDGTRALRDAVLVSRRTVLVAFLAPSVVELGIIASLFAVLCAWFRVTDGLWYVPLRLELLLIVPAVACLLLIAFGIGSITAVLGQGNRDTRWTVGFLLGPWMLVTPVLYPLSTVPHDLRWTLAANPAALPVLLMREAVFADVGLTTSIVAGGTIGARALALVGLAFQRASAP
jgi:ABC-type polysaccharide/polyol phosphate export permease